MQQYPKDVLEGIKKHLKEEKARLVVRVAELATQDPFNDPDRTIDNAASDTEANEESNHDRMSAIIDEVKAQQVAIDHALERIENGTYGACVRCGAMIDTDRLRILPTATLCLDCEAKKSIRS
ncbi:MAG: TraR/DksA family transcriptional regulator [Patescibacteria group bacterium]